MLTFLLKYTFGAYESALALFHVFFISGLRLKEYHLRLIVKEKEQWQNHVMTLKTSARKWQISIPSCFTGQTCYQ